MADRSGDTYWDGKDVVTRSVGATKTAGDVEAANARAKYDPAMRKPDASSLDDADVSPLGLAAKREALRKKKAAATASGRAQAVKSMLKESE